ncbi:MAG: alpha/beta fold hydrolase [Verrucomicrobiota bacterium]
MIWAIHGNLGFPGDWLGISQSLAPYQLHTPALWESPHMGFRGWTNRANDAAEALDPDPVIMGYSLGGRLAMHAVADQTPPLWKAAIFISAHPGFRDSQVMERDVRRRQDLAWASSIRNSKPADFLEQWNAQSVLQGPAPPSQHEVVRVYTEPIAQAFENWSLGVQEDLRPQLQASEVPQLWVVGADDTKFRAIAEEAVEGIPNAQLNVIENCGHRVLLQRPDALARCVREFLSSLSIST